MIGIHSKQHIVFDTNTETLSILTVALHKLNYSIIYKTLQIRTHSELQV